MGPIDRLGAEPSWSLTLATLAEERELDLLELLPDDGIALRCLEVSITAKDCQHAVWLGGARGKLRAGIQQMIDARLGAGQRWLLLWTEGRWPRGHLVTRLSLDTAVETFGLGILAPLSPTRVALSEGPVPFTKEAVAHFKALHIATGATGLIGCRVQCHQEPAAVALRWHIAPQQVPKVLEHLEATPALEEVSTVLEGLSQGLSRPEISLEASYTPEPASRFLLGLANVPTNRVLGLLRALWGEEQSQSLRSLARTLRTKRLAHVQVEVGSAGIYGVRAQLTAGGHGLPKRW